jgi:hypothetical protein
MARNCFSLPTKISEPEMVNLNGFVLKDKEVTGGVVLKLTRTIRLEKTDLYLYF